MKPLRSLLRATCVQIDSHRGQQPCLCPGSTAVLLGDKFDLENLSEGTKGIVWRSKGEEIFEKHPPPVSLLLPRAKCCLQSVQRKVSSVKLGFLFSDLRCGLEACLPTLKILGRGGSSCLKLRKKISYRWPPCLDFR